MHFLNKTGGREGKSCQSVDRKDDGFSMSKRPLQGSYDTNDTNASSPQLYWLPYPLLSGRRTPTFFTTLTLFLETAVFRTKSGSFYGLSTINSNSILRWLRSIVKSMSLQSSHDQHDDGKFYLQRSFALFSNLGSSEYILLTDQCALRCLISCTICVIVLGYACLEVCRVLDYFGDGFLKPQSVAYGNKHAELGQRGG